MGRNIICEIMEKFAVTEKERERERKAEQYSMICQVYYV